MYRDDEGAAQASGALVTDGGHRGRRLIHAVLALALVAVGAALAYWLLSAEEQVGRRAPPERTARLVGVTQARVGSERITVTAWGEVEASRELVLRPRISGRVENVAAAFDPGRRVMAGQPLVELEARPYELALESARAELTRAQADLALERGQQAVAEREYELLGESVTEDERELILRQPQLRSAQADVAAARAQIAEAELDLSYTSVAAPFDGLVISRDVAPGAEVGSSTDLGTLVGLDRWWVELTVPVSALQWIDVPPDGESRGSAVRLHYENAWRDGVYRTGYVTALIDRLEENGRMARLQVAIDDPLGREADEAVPRVLLGAFVRGAVQGRSVDDAVALDPAWLHDGNTVWVMTADDELAFREVEIAYRDRQRVIVTDGLEAGERIVTSRISTPAAGMPLRVGDSGAGANRNGD
ncbi:efflux RND transporter periplasmic adaptor subunit [Arhodomonas sp. AD133]|uniref:efflux RND transporter periplasmic adaptor subunit n=1 Tax=Arhodomonas sp. AD133 TaxID=3415009 RepID=UPI003EBE8EBA